MATGPGEAATGVPPLPGDGREEDAPLPGAAGAAPGEPAEAGGAPPAAGGGGAKARWAADLFDQLEADEKMRQQVSAARELLSGTAQVQMTMQGLLDRPGGGVLRPIFAQAMEDQEADRATARMALEVLDEFVSEADLRRGRLHRRRGEPAVLAGGARGEEQPRQRPSQGEAAPDTRRARFTVAALAHPEGEVAFLEAQLRSALDEETDDAARSVFRR